MRLYYNKYTKEFSILTIKRGVEIVKFKGKNYLLGKYYEYTPRNKDSKISTSLDDHSV